MQKKKMKKINHNQNLNCSEIIHKQNLKDHYLEVTHKCKRISHHHHYLVEIKIRPHKAHFLAELLSLFKNLDLCLVVQSQLKMMRNQKALYLVVEMHQLHHKLVEAYLVEVLKLTIKNKKQDFLDKILTNP